MHAFGVCPLPPAPQPRWAALPRLHFGDVTAFFALHSVLSACVRHGDVSPLSAYSTCSRNTRRPLVKTTNLPFPEVRWASLTVRCFSLSKSNGSQFYVILYAFFASMIRRISESTFAMPILAIWAIFAMHCSDEAAQIPSLSRRTELWTAICADR